MSRRLFSKRTSTIISLLLTLFILIGQRYHWFDNVQKAAESGQPGLYHVVDFVDGDTVAVNMSGKKETIRFIGVDTPETHDPRKAVQCFGLAAANFTKNLIGQNEVRLESDPLSSNRDRYDRLLRYIYLTNGTLVNAEIIKQGYGFAYLSFPFTKSEEFRQYQTSARQQNKGLWGSCQPQINQFGGFTSNNDH